MKNAFTRFAFFTHKVNRQQVQFFFAVLALLALVLGAGAPVDGGGIIR